MSRERERDCESWRKTVGVTKGQKAVFQLEQILTDMLQLYFHSLPDGRREEQQQQQFVNIRR